MKLIAVRPKTDALRHYLELEAECKDASPLADASKPHLYPTPIAGEGAVSAGGAADRINTLLDVLEDIGMTRVP